MKVYIKYKFTLINKVKILNASLLFNGSSLNIFKLSLDLLGFLRKKNPDGVGDVLRDIGLVVVEVLGGELDGLGFSVVLQGDGLGGTTYDL